MIWALVVRLPPIQTWEVVKSDNSCSPLFVVAATGIRRHIVDAQSFPFQSLTYPNLTAAGAYSPEEVYSHEDVTTLVQYAALRGVRVVVEFDTPGHT